MVKIKLFQTLIMVLLLSCISFSSEKIRALIIDGINNHDWENTTIATKATLEQTGRFTVDVNTSPSRNVPKDEWKAWHPKFFDYQVIASNFNDDCEEEAVVISPDKLEWPGLSTREIRNSSDHADLIGLFREFREFDKPKVTNGIPDYSAAAIEKQYRELKTFQSRLAAIDPCGWSVSEQIDYHLVRAEMNGLEFKHRVLRPWSRDPSFYQNLIPRLRRIQKLPLKGEVLIRFRTRLEAIPEIIKQAKMNLKNLSEVAGDLATFAIHNLESSTSFQSLATQLIDHHPDLVPDVKEAQASIDDYLGWLKENHSKMTASAGVGKENYNWMLKNVYLFPYTWEECRMIVELEDNRVITFQKLEENRNRNLPPLKPVASQEEYRSHIQETLHHLMKFIRDEEIFTVQDYLVIDDYWESRMRATTRPWPEKMEDLIKQDYFLLFGLRDTLFHETHEMLGHDFDLLRVRQDDRPIRGNREHEGPYDVALSRVEGFAFALEELLMHAGYLDKRPRRSREIAYEQAAYRTVRALSDLYMHREDWSLTDAMEFCVANAPRGDLLDDSHQLWSELQTTLRSVSWHMQMVVGKVQFMKLFRDRAQQLGDEFNLRQFIDEFFAAGMIPISLIRWEMTGYNDEIKKLW
jgi:hypothetical protein